jgi:hypothetical protein
MHRTSFNGWTCGIKVLDNLVAEPRLPASAGHFISLLPRVPFKNGMAEAPHETVDP